MTGFLEGDEPNPALVAIAARAAITALIFGFVFIFIPWPKFLTYITGIWMLRGIVDVGLSVQGVGQFRVIASQWTATERRRFIVNLCAKAIGNALWFGACLYFFGR